MKIERKSGQTKFIGNDLKGGFEGVPEGQLRVGGMGDNMPMVDAAHWNENRRVELRYREALMLSSQ